MASDRSELGISLSFMPRDTGQNPVTYLRIDFLIYAYEDLAVFSLGEVRDQSRPSKKQVAILKYDNSRIYSKRVYTKGLLQSSGLQPVVTTAGLEKLGQWGREGIVTGVQKGLLLESATLREESPVRSRGQLCRAGVWGVQIPSLVVPAPLTPLTG